MNINKFYIKKSESVINQTLILVDYINKKVKTDNFQKLIRIISNTFGIPLEKVEFEIKKNLVENHNFQIGKFSKKFNLVFMPISVIKYLTSFFYILIFSSKYKNPPEKCEIVFDEILSDDERKRVLPLLNKFETYRIITEKNYENNKHSFIYRKQIGACRKFILSHLFQIIFNNLFLSIFLSFKENTNLVPLILGQIKKIIKYETIFQNIQAKYLIQERPYTTSAIKNFIFKKYGGQTTCCTQRIIFHLGQTGFYINTDILFSLGKETSKILELTGSEIVKICPVGSMYFSNKWINSKKIATEKIDIIHLSGNDSPSFQTDSKYLNNYYEQLTWLKKLSIDFPLLKVVLKHHEGNKFNDAKELNILKGSNIKRLSGPTEPGKVNYSYGYAINSRIRLTWASTMAYELLGHGYSCFFLDPNLENSAFLHEYDYNKSYRIPSYISLKNKVREILERTKPEIIENKNNFCMDSLNTEEEIVKILKKN